MISSARVNLEAAAPLTHGKPSPASRLPHQRISEGDNRPAERAASNQAHHGAKMGIMCRELQFWQRQIGEPISQNLLLRDVNGNDNRTIIVQVW